MQHFEVSRKITLTKEASDEDIKGALLARLRRNLAVTSMKDNEAGFSLSGTTGGCKKFIRHAQIELQASVIKDRETVRVIMSGHSKTATSLLVTYVSLVFFVLVAGLLPGSIETDGLNSGAMDALVLMIFGIFIFYDLNKKLMEPQALLEAVLESVDVEFG